MSDIDRSEVDRDELARLIWETRQDVIFHQLNDSHSDDTWDSIDPSERSIFIETARAILASDWVQGLMFQKQQARHYFEESERYHAQVHELQEAMSQVRREAAAEAEEKLAWMRSDLREWSSDREAVIAEARRDAAAKALREAADQMPAYHDRDVPEWAITSACKWLRERADREVGQ